MLVPRLNHNLSSGQTERKVCLVRHCPTTAQVHHGLRCGHVAMKQLTGILPLLSHENPVWPQVCSLPSSET